MANLRDDWLTLGCKEGASETTHYDNAHTGLALRCRASGSKSWTFEYRLPGSPNKRRVVYGAAGEAPPALTYNDALIQYLGDVKGLMRTKDVVADGKILQQPDPVDPRERRLAPVIPAVGTIGEALEMYFAERLGEHARRQKGKRKGELIGEKGKHDKKARLQRWLGDKHGKRQLTSFSRDDVKSLLNGAEKTGNAAATHLLQRDLKAFFKFCVDEGYRREASPVPTDQTWGKIEQRDRFLSDRELAAVLKGVRAESYPFRHIYLLLLLTGLRRAEVCEARWSEIDFEVKTWILPKERTKNRAGHILPLSDLVISVLRDAERHHRGVYIFTTRANDKPVQDLGTAWARTGERTDHGAQARIVDIAERELGNPMPSWVVHDLRRTLRTNLSQLGVSRDVKEAVLNHTDDELVETYDRYEYLPEMLEALQKWAQKLATLGLVVEQRTLPTPQKLLPAPAA